MKKYISRNRFQLLASKLYFAEPQKPNDATKTFYIDEMVDCMKAAFQCSQQDSPRQAINEGIRSSLKQYMPLKPVKRGIKLRCDSITEYCYNLNVYRGCETEKIDGTLGERVMEKFCTTIHSLFRSFFHFCQIITEAAISSC